MKRERRRKVERRLAVAANRQLGELVRFANTCAVDPLLGARRRKPRRGVEVAPRLLKMLQEHAAEFGYVACACGCGRLALIQRDSRAYYEPACRARAGKARRTKRRTARAARLKTVSLADAARLAGVSVAKFRREYICSGEVKPIRVRGHVRPRARIKDIRARFTPRDN